MNRWVALVLFLAACFAVAGVAGWLTRAAVLTWYPTIAKPSWNPPNAAFAPVWTTLYILMAIAGWLVWLQPPGPARSRALLIFFVQLALNFAWSPLFFRFHQIGAAAAEIVLLWCAIGAFILFAWNVSRAAAWLFLPYLAWVSFAAFLNWTIWTLNRGRGAGS